MSQLQSTPPPNCNDSNPNVATAPLNYTDIKIFIHFL